MTIRLLLTLLVLGLGGGEHRANSAPAWVEQSDSLTAQALPAEASVSEANEQQNDVDLDAIPSTRTTQSGSLTTVFIGGSEQQHAQPACVPQARAPPHLT